MALLVFLGLGGATGIVAGLTRSAWALVPISATTAVLALVGAIAAGGSVGLLVASVPAGAAAVQAGYVVGALVAGRRRRPLPPERPPQDPTP
jgi:hypothetical protein